MCPAHSEVAFDDAVPLLPRLPNGNRVAILEQIGVRLDPDSRGFTTGTPSGRGELRGWLDLPGGAPFDPVALLFAVVATLACLLPSLRASRIDPLLALRG